MFKPFAALVLSGVMAVTSLSPAPARAGDAEDLAKLLFGALVIYGIADAVDDRNDRRREAQKRTETRGHTGAHLGSVITPHKPRARHARSNELPSACILTHRTGYDQSRTVFGNQCLKHNFRHYAHLPEHCFRRFDTVRGVRVGWGRKCLKREGYIW